MMYFKVLNADGSCYHGGKGNWPLPNGKPGAWMPPVSGELSPCSNGYHILKPEHLIEWIGPAIFEVEPSDEIIHDGNKSVTRTARLVRHFETWNERTARLFACDCAEHVLKFFEEKHPQDNRPRRAIEVARLFANSKATEEERGAAWDAAWYSASSGAARYAARSVAAWAAAWYAASRVAAWVAGWYAASSAAASSASWDAERKWQTNLLMEILGVKQ